MIQRKKLNLNRYKEKPRKKITKPTQIMGGDRIPRAYQDPFMSWAETRRQGK